MFSFLRIIALVLILIVGYSCKKEKDTLFLIKESNQTNILFENTLIPSPELNILTYLYYYNGAGIASGDFNNDGLEDLYFTANQKANVLYLNKGNFEFQDATSSVILDKEGWTTGVTTVDINNDGLLDIYVCKVGDYRGIKGENKLYVNQGNNIEGIPEFKEQASTYNLNISSFSTQASFFDYDLDGDLDMYLLNHSVHPNRTYGRGSKRKQIDTVSGDRLYRNDNNLYVDVSQEAGIFQGAIGYGLGIATSDVNNDGYPDIYIGNDFFENDYLYINQKDGTFKEIINTGKKNIQHTSHFSMGVDIADINNDGLTDIVSLDMLPEDLETYQTSGTEYGYTTYNQYLKNGYKAQYMQNALQVNQGNNNFSEIAFYAGIAATEWSWAPLIADYDNDGFKDIFISNGIIGATNDMDFISFIANDKIQKRINKGMKKEDLALINELPHKKKKNYFFRNKADLTFENVSDSWSNESASYSNGAIYVDLDNDGDMDVVTNNCNEKAFIYENQSDKKLFQTNYVKLKLVGSPKNRNAIGAKATMYTKKGIQTFEVFTTRGYLSSVSPIIHFGLGKTNSIDSVRVLWPDNRESVFKDIEINTTAILSIEKGIVRKSQDIKPITLLKNDVLAIPFKHQDYETKDFNFEPLAPYATSNEGPQLSVMDIDKDGLQDVFIPGGRFQTGKLFKQQPDGSFKKIEQPDIDLDNKREDTDACFFDADKDGDLDLVLVSGGNEKLYSASNAPQLYINTDGRFENKLKALPALKINASTVIAADIDQDGDQDLFIGSSGVSGTYGQIANSYVLVNDGFGNFLNKNNLKVSESQKIGQVFDAQFVDFNTDSYPDLLVAGHYMPIRILMNDGQGNFIKEINASLKNTRGWWNCIRAFDADKDGDLDIVAGNWGLNTRLNASPEKPIRLYLNDFDDNGKIDPLVTYFYQGKETLIATKDELTKQLPVLNKKYLSYSDFAKADFQDYFSKSKIDKAEKKEVHTLRTTYFENTGNLDFVAHELPWKTQVSSVHDILIHDINHDSFPDMIVGGNTYEISTQLSRLDASYGTVLLNDQKGNFESYDQSGLISKGAVRSINEITVKDTTYFLFGVNNDSLQVVKKNK